MARRKHISKPEYTYPKGPPERAYARLCIEHTQLSDEKIARITFCSLAEVKAMRAPAEGRGR